MDFEVVNASHFAADTFRLTVAIDKLPATYDLSYWSQSVGDELEIWAGFKTGGASSLASLIYAQVDDVIADPVERTLTLSGRDLSARFIDKKIDKEFQQQTASDVVQTLAQNHQMGSAVTPTTAKVGTFYELYHSRITKDQSEWDLLTVLAQHEGYDLWVSGKTLNFQPPVADSVPPYVLQYNDNGTGVPSGNFQQLKLCRSQTLARDVIVRVKSWNQAQEIVVTAEARRQPVKSVKGLGITTQLFTFHPPNLNQEQANQYANSKADDITKHEKVITASLPGDILLTNRSLIQLTGSESDWDQFYNVDTVIRKMSVRDGFSMELRAKNHSTQSTT
jgi:hypothetical protein